MIRISWNEGVRSVSRLEESVTIAHSGVFSLDCAYSHYTPESNIPKVFMKTLLTNTLVLLYIGIIALICVIYFKFVKKEAIRGNRKFKHSIYISCFVLGFNHMLSLYKVNLFNFECKNLYRKDTPIYYMSQDYDVECWSGVHNGWTFGFSLPILLIIGLVIPIFLIVKMKRADKKKLFNQNEFMGKYLFLYAGLKPEYAYWEVLTHMKKMIAILIVLLGGLSSPNLQIYLVLYVFAGCLINLIRKKPYENHVCYKIDRMSLILVLLINLFGIYYGSTGYIKGIDEIISVTGVILVIYFWLYWLLEYNIELKMRIYNKLFAKSTSTSIGFFKKWTY